MPSHEVDMAMTYQEIFDALYDVVPAQEEVAPDEYGQIKCYECLTTLQEKGFTPTQAMTMVLGTMLDVRPVKREMARVEQQMASVNFVEDIVHG